MINLNTTVLFIPVGSVLVREFDCNNINHHLYTCLDPVHISFAVWTFLWGVPYLLIQLMGTSSSG